MNPNSTTDRLPYPHTVEEAAAALDKIKPDWYKSINFATLNMGSCNRCIIGQVFNTVGVLDWDRLMKNTFENIPKFYTENPPFGYTTNREEWIREVEQRLEAQSPLG